MTLDATITSAQDFLTRALSDAQADTYTLTNLKTAKLLLAQELARFTSQRVIDQANGRGVKTTYSANGRSVDWNGYLKTVTEQICFLDKCIAEIENRMNPYEIRSTGIT